MRENNNLIDMKIFVDSVKIIFESGKSFYHLHIEDNDDFIKIGYKTGSGQFNVKSVRIPRNIFMDDETFLVFGLIQAEASKSLKSGTFQFSNSEYSSVERVLNYFINYWKIPIEEWSVQITYWRKDFEEKKEVLKQYWQRLGIKHISLFSGTQYRTSDNAKEYGVASIRLNSKIMSGLILNFLNSVIQTMIKEKISYMGNYLTGLFEGDGTLSTHNKKFQFIGLAFNPESDELIHYTSILNEIGVKFNVETIIKSKRRCIFIKNWNSYIKLLKVTNGCLFLNHRNRIFINGFFNNQYVKSLLRLKDFQNHDFITVDIYAKQFNITRRAALGCLTRLESLEYMTRKRHIRTFRYNITKEGKEFIEMIRILEGMLNDHQKTDCRDTRTLNN